MDRSPISRNEPLVTRVLLLRMALMASAIVISTLGWFIARTAQGIPEAQVRTETFTLLAICEWFNVLNCRWVHRSAFTLDVFRNKWLIGGLLFGNLLQIAVVFWTPLGRIFSLREVVALAIVGSLVLWVEELRKLVERRRLADERVAGPKSAFMEPGDDGTNWAESASLHGNPSCQGNWQFHNLYAWSFFGLPKLYWARTGRGNHVDRVL